MDTHELSRSDVFDAHFHIIDPRFPIQSNQGFRPDTFTVEHYRQRTAGFQIVGGAVVSGSFQAFDQTYLVDALKLLGNSFVGVTQLPGDVNDETILSLHAAGVRAVRFNLYRGGSASLEELEHLAHRVYDLAGWHVELYVDSKDLIDLEGRLTKLPRVSIDHLGMTSDGLPVLLRMLSAGARVKATGFGRVEVDVPQALKALCSVNPEAVMFGTDLPSTRARRPFEDSDAALILDTLGEQLGKRVLCDNALAFYRLFSGGGRG